MSEKVEVGAEVPRTRYDEVPYESNPFPQTHPDGLAALATLFGMQPPELESARVLELGCASGGNLVPHALLLPQARFVGVDLSSRQIDEGQALVDALGVGNVEFRHMSITDIDAGFGTFDYIICHGVYSWVPDAVQDHILQVCSRNLAPNGVAYVSYNTYPGWHMRGMIRDMMLYHTGQFDDARMQVAQARALLDFLSQNAPGGGNNAYGMMLRSELELLRKQKDYYLYHDHLEEVNDPVYFHQFAERAGRHELQYLAEADFSAMLASNFPAGVSEMLNKIAPEIIHMEQYMDFLRNRYFRQTLLAHRDIRLKRNIEPSSVQGFYVASPAKPKAPADPEALRSGEKMEFTTPKSNSIGTTRPVTKAALLVLAERWPEAVRFPALCTAAMERLGESPQAGAELPEVTRNFLAHDLLRCFSNNFIEFHVRPPPVCAQPPERPVATALARHQAARGRPVTNLRHAVVEVDGFGRNLLSLLDGSRDAGALVDVLAEQVFAGTLTMQIDGAPVSDAARVRPVLGQALPKSLETLAQRSLLYA